MERIVGPADCALAVALPLSLEDFARQAAAGDRDFARSVARNSGRSVEQAWLAEVDDEALRKLVARLLRRL